MTISRAKPAGWGVGDKLTSAEQNQVDTNTTYALDKRAGQTDTLGSVVTVSGDLLLDPTGRVAANANGAIIEASASGAIIKASANGAKVAATAAGALIRTETGGRIELADNDYPGLAAGHTGRSFIRYVPAGRVTGISSAMLSILSDGQSTFYFPPSDTTLYMTYGVQQIAFGSVDTGSNTNAKAVIYVIDDYLQNGATLASVALTLVGTAGHVALPGVMPRLRVAAYDAVAFTAASLYSGGAVADGSASTAAYQTNHAVTVTCNQNNTIDKASKTYAVIVWNEGYTNAISGLALLGLKLTQTITDLRPH